MSRTRIKGKDISFTVEGVTYEGDTNSVLLVREAADTSTADGYVTFTDVAEASDGLVWKLNINAFQSTAQGSGSAKSLHTLVWEAAVDGDELDFVFKPHGNSTASTNQPHYSGTAVVAKGVYPPVGGAAGTTAFSWDYSFTVKDNALTKVIA